MSKKKSNKVAANLQLGLYTEMVNFWHKDDFFKFYFPTLVKVYPQQNLIQKLSPPSNIQTTLKSPDFITLLILKL